MVQSGQEKPGLLAKTGPKMFTEGLKGAPYRGGFRAGLYHKLRRRRNDGVTQDGCGIAEANTIRSYPAMTKCDCSRRPKKDSIAIEALANIAWQAQNAISTRTQATGNRHAGNPALRTDFQNVGVV
jgi:hypothetical protein